MTQRPGIPTTADASSTLRLALDGARQELLAAFDAKRDADRRFVAAFTAYEATAEACRGAIRAAGSDRPRRRTGL